ncbi:MAG: hypothetical protein LAT64_14120 [Phycisphaerales bacterium]|nr:hypothetical protein [Planctomycetota bacterium]MCH8509887.1 hypothetical protein [Phycisphaerales bacterium]
MPHRYAVITDPRHLARARRAAVAMIACVVLAYIAVWACYLHTTVFAIRIYAPLPFLIGFYVFHSLHTRSLRLPKDESPLLPDPFPLIFFMGVGLMTLMPFIAIPADPFMPTTAYTALIGVPLIAAGIVAIAYGLFGRRAIEPACPNCDYPLAGLSLPTPCPECAHPLEPADADRQSAARTTRPRVLWSGAGSIAAGLLFIFLIRNAPDAFYRALPGPAHRLLASIESEALRTLDTDALNPTQRARLADRILRERARRKQPIEINDQVDWFAHEIAAGNLDSTFTDRYAFDGFDLRIIHDTPVPAGEPFRVSIAGAPPFYSPDIDVRYFFAGFEFDANGPVARATRDYPLYGFDTTLEQRDRNAQRYRESNLTPLPYPTHTLAIDRPTRVRARIIVFVIPHPWTAAPTITWHDDGTYTITPEPLTTHELSAETTIHPSP